MASSVATSKGEKMSKVFTSLIRDENGLILPCVENFYKYCEQKKLMGVKCKMCEAISWPPRSLCSKCFSNTMEWIEFSLQGKLLTYTIIHFPPGQFRALVPYAVGIVKLDVGAQLPGMIKNLKLEDLKIGMELQVDFETTIPKEWPKWPRYFFKPAAQSVVEADKTGLRL